MKDMIYVFFSLQAKNSKNCSNTTTNDKWNGFSSIKEMKILIMCSRLSLLSLYQQNYPISLGKHNLKSITCAYI